MKAANGFTATFTRAFTVTIPGGLLALGLLFSASQASAEEPAGFSQAELDQMLAPIALYPDTVLSHVLIAATYPLEVVQAARWSRANPGYTGERAVAAVEHKPWDPSVMALVAFPELLARMDADLDWTQRLGDAFLVQEYEVLDTVQYLRDDAYAAGHLRSNEYVRVVREPEYIYIEPAVTRVVYVPYYDPRVVYGSWRYSAYPPVYWNHPHGYRYRSGYRPSSGFSFYWSSGHHVQPAFFFSSFHWSSRRVVVHDHHRYGHRNRGHYGHGGHGFSSGRELARYKDARHWTHNPEHRRGVAYSRGIDERHRLKASRRSQIRSVSMPASTNRRDSSRVRQDLLRQRSSTGNTATQRSAGNRAGNRTTGNRSTADSHRLGAAQRQAGRDGDSAGTRRTQLRSQSQSQLQSQLQSQSRSESPSRSQSRSQARSRTSEPDSRSSRLRASAARETDAPSTSRATSRTMTRAAAQSTSRQRAPDRAASLRTPTSKSSTRRSAALGRGTDHGRRSDSSAATRRSDIRAKASGRVVESRQRTTPPGRSSTAGSNNAAEARSGRRAAVTGKSGSRNRAAPSRSRARAQSSRAETIRSQRRDRPTPL